MSSRRPSSASSRIAQAGFWSSLFAVAGFALYPDLTLPEPAITQGFTDKVYHVAGFSALTILAGVGWRMNSILLVALSLAAVGLELLQIFAQGRGVFFSDILANFAGIGVGSLLIYLAGPRSGRDGSG